MNIAELYMENEKNRKEEQKNERTRKRFELANTILKSFQNEKLVDDVTKVLIERGNVTVTGFGCLCQGGYCSWQRGFTDYLKTFHEEWREKGVLVRYCIKGVIFTVQNFCGNSLSSVTLDIADYVEGDD